MHQIHFDRDSAMEPDRELTTLPRVPNRTRSRNPFDAYGVSFSQCLRRLVLRPATPFHFNNSH